MIKAFNDSKNIGENKDKVKNRGHKMVDYIILNTKDWSQVKINMRIAICYTIMGNAGYDIVPVIDGDKIIFKGIPVDPNDIITQDIFDQYFKQWELEQEQQAQKDLDEQKKKQAEVDNSPFKNILFDDIDPLVDPIRSLDEMKSILKTFMKYVISRGI